MPRIAVEVAVVGEPVGLILPSEKPGQAGQRIRSGKLVAVRESLINLDQQRFILVAVTALNNVDGTIGALSSGGDCRRSDASRYYRPAKRRSPVEEIEIALEQLVDLFAKHEIRGDRQIAPHLPLDTNAELLGIGNLEIG